MATILNIPNCGATSTGNTGKEGCDLVRKTFKGMILTDPSVEFDSSDLASLSAFVAAVNAGVIAARGSRVYPIHDIVNFEDNTSEATQGSLGNLVNTQIDLSDAIPSFLLRHYNGEAFHKKLARFKSQSVRVIFYDDAYTLFGTADSNGKFKGYSVAQFRTLPAKFGDASNPAQYPFRIVLSSAAEYVDNAAFVIGDSSISSINGLIDVVLSMFSQSTNVIKIAGVTEGAGTNIIELYNGELDAAAAWSVLNAQTGAAFTVTSYVYDSTNKVMTITLDSTAYTALTSGQKVTIDFVSASALSALGVTPYESKGKVTITKP